MPSYNTKIIKGECTRWFSRFVNIQQSFIWLICFLCLSNSFDLTDCDGPLLRYHHSFWKVMYLPVWDGSLYFCVCIVHVVCMCCTHMRVWVYHLCMYMWLPEQDMECFPLLLTLVPWYRVSWWTGSLLFQPGWLAAKLSGFAPASQYRVTGTSIYACLYVSTGDSNPSICMLSESAIFPTKSSPQVLIVNFGCQYDRI